MEKLSKCEVQITQTLFKSYGDQTVNKDRIIQPSIATLATACLMLASFSPLLVQKLSASKILLRNISMAALTTMAVIASREIAIWGDETQRDNLVNGDAPNHKLLPLTKIVLPLGHPNGTLRKYCNLSPFKLLILGGAAVYLSASFYKGLSHRTVNVLTYGNLSIMALAVLTSATLLGSFYAIDAVHEAKHDK